MEHGLVGQSMDHHSEGKEAFHRRSLLQENSKTPETLLVKNYASQGEKICSQLKKNFGLIPRYGSEAQSGEHSSRRLKDTLREKRLPKQARSPQI